MLKEKLNYKKLKSTELDKVIGHNLRVIRTNKGLKQKDIANHLGISFQQIQKYESGANRIAASVLYEFAKILDVTVSDFFVDILEEPQDVVCARKNAELLEIFKKIENPNLKKKVIDLLSAMVQP
jgi:transcriptional regulator with XRE-family HTH domain